MINIPKKLWYIISPDREDNLAYMTYYEENAAFEKRKTTGTDWASPRRTKWNPETKIYEEIDIKAPIGVIVDNYPIKGIYIGSSVSRWSTSNKLFRVNDPRGFTVEVPTDNIATLLHLTTVTHGIVEEECVWAREGSNHIILPINSEPYLLTLDKMDTIANKLIKVGDLKTGDVVKLFEDTREYTFMGRGKVTWRIKPYTTRYRYSSNYGYDKNYLSEAEYTGRGYVNIFSRVYTYFDTGELRYETFSNPKIVGIVGNNPDARKLLPKLYPPQVAYKIYGWHFESEVIGVKWKD